MPLKDGDPNPTKTKSNCLCLPFFGHFLTPLERVAATTSSCVCVFFVFIIFNKDTKKTSRSVYIYLSLKQFIETGAQRLENS